jgi:hypothetical protein
MTRSRFVKKVGQLNQKSPSMFLHGTPAIDFADASGANHKTADFSLPLSFH